MKHEFWNTDPTNKATLLLAHPDGDKVIEIPAGGNVAVELNRRQANAVGKLRVRLLGMGILVTILDTTPQILHSPFTHD
jgi:hypothetical protein